MSITAHELARELLQCADLPVVASIDISTCDADSGRRIYTNETFGINWYGLPPSGVNGNYGLGSATGITLLFGAEPKDNEGKEL